MPLLLFGVDSIIKAITTGNTRKQNKSKSFKRLTGTLLRVGKIMQKL